MSLESLNERITRRRLLQLLAVSSAGLALSACAPAQSQPAAPGAATQAPTSQVAGAKATTGGSFKLGVLANYKGDALEQALPVFEKATGIKVSLDKLPDTNLSDKLAVSYASGSPDYDVAMMDEPWVPGLTSYLTDLDPLIARDNIDLKQFVPNGLAAGVVDGKRVALPLDPNVMMLWYRKDLFEAKGLKAPTNFNEIIDAAQKLNDPANGIAGISVTGKKDAQTSTTAILLLWNNGQDVITKDGKFGFDSPEGIKALETYANLIKSAPSGVLGYGATEELDAFYTGKAAMVFYWASIGPNATNPQKSQVADKVGWTSVPNGMRGVWTLGIPQASKNKDAAWEWMKWITGPDGSRLFTQNGGGHSPRFDVLQSADFQKKYPWAPDLEKALSASRARPQISSWNAVQTAIIDMTSAVLAGQKSPADATKSAAEQVASYIKK